MYNDLFSIGNITIHSYGLCTGLSLIAALLLACNRAKKRNMSEDIVYGILLVGVIFGYLASKTTYVLVEWKSFIQNPRMFLSQSGFVVMGGLLGGILAVWAYCTIKKVNFLDYFDLCVPSIALAQCIGRIGCFMAGCCYGKETDSFIGIAFKHSMFAPNNVKLIPTQLISAGLDLIHMFILLAIAKKVTKKGFTSATYICLYSIGRFLLEFLRNDDRGSVGVFSTSQFGSLVTLAVGAIYLLWAVKHTEKAVVAEGKAVSEEISE